MIEKVVSGEGKRRYLKYEAARCAVANSLLPRISLSEARLKIPIQRKTSDLASWVFLNVWLFEDSISLKHFWSFNCKGDVNFLLLMPSCNCTYLLCLFLTTFSQVIPPFLLQFLQLSHFAQFQHSQGHSVSANECANIQCIEVCADFQRPVIIGWKSLTQKETVVDPCVRWGQKLYCPKEHKEHQEYFMRLISIAFKFSCMGLVGWNRVSVGPLMQHAGKSRTSPFGCMTGSAVSMTETCWSWVVALTSGQIQAVLRCRIPSSPGYCPPSSYHTASSG